MARRIQKIQYRNYHNYNHRLFYLTGTFLLCLTTFVPYLLVEGRPTASPALTEDAEVDSFFDSQKHLSQSQTKDSEPQKRMIVRVIVSSSSSSTSSQEDQQHQETPDYAHDAPFHDFSFPVQPEPETSSSTTTAPVIKMSDGRVSPDPPEKKDVEDIFSAFYKAFSNQHSVDASHNVERFQLFYPGTADKREVNTNGPPSSPFQRGFERISSLQPGQRKIVTSTIISSTSTEDPEFGGHQYHEPNNTPFESKRNNFDELKVVAVSSSTSIAKTPRPKWRPPQSSPPIVSVSTSSSWTSHSYHQQQHPLTNYNFLKTETSSPTVTTETVPDSTRTVRRRHRVRQRNRDTSRPDVVVSVSSSSSQNGETSHPDNNTPVASPLVQIRRTTPSPPTSSTGWTPMVWGEPAKVWGEPAKVWGEPAKVWGEPSKVWTKPEQLWGHGPSSSSTSTSTQGPVAVLSSATSRRPRYIIRTPKALTPPISKSSKYKVPPHAAFLHQGRDEDYPRDEGTPSGAEEQDDEEGGTFVILGEDEEEQDSIDGSFDHHLGIPPVSPRPISLDQFKALNFSYHYPFKNLNLSRLSSQDIESNGNSSITSSSSGPFESNSFIVNTYDANNNSNSINSNNSDLNFTNNSTEENSGTKFGYVLEGNNVRRYRVEERTSDGFIVGEYGVLNNQNAFLRGVRYTADGTINPRLIHEALMKFLSLRRR